MLYMHYFTLSVDRGSDLYQEIAYHFKTITASMIKKKREQVGGYIYESANICTQIGLKENNAT